VWRATMAPRIQCGTACSALVHGLHAYPYGFMRATRTRLCVRAGSLPGRVEEDSALRLRVCCADGFTRVCCRKGNVPWASGLLPLPSTGSSLRMPSWPCSTRVPLQVWTVHICRSTGCWCIAAGRVQPCEVWKTEGLPRSVMHM
jgi:hypothetical protein